MKNNRFLNKVGAFLISLLIVTSFASCKNSGKTSSAASSSKAVTASSSSELSASSSEVSSTSAVSSKSESSSNKTTAAASKTSSKTSSSQKSSNSLSVSVTIDATKGGKGMLASSKKVEITKGQSVYDALKKCCGSNIKIASKGAGNSVYVAGIGGLSEFDKGSQSGWVYLVNGKIASESCGAYKLSGGENIKWVYTLDNGRTEGSK